MSIVWSLILISIMVCQSEYQYDFVQRSIETIVSNREVNTCNFARRANENLITVSPIEVLIRPHKQKSAVLLERGVNVDNLIAVKQIENDKSCSNLGLINARSVRNKSYKIIDSIHQNNLDILVATETWLGEKDDHIIPEITPEDFQCLRKDRKTGRGGGIAVICRKSMNPKQLSTVDYSSFEHDVLRLSTKSGHIRLIIVYRPPSTSKDIFIDEFTTLLETHIFSTDKVLIVGDFNIAMDKPTDKKVTQFMDLLRVFALKQHVKDFTHIDGHVLDLVISAESDSVIKDKVTVQSLISYHFLVVCPLDITTEIDAPKSVKCRKISDIDLASFQTDIVESKLNETSTLDKTLDEIVLEYNETLLSLLDKHAPETVKTLKPRVRQPWYTTELRSLRRVSRQKERKMRKTPKNHPNFSAVKADFKLAEELYFESVDTSKTSYYSNLVISNKKDQSKLYKVLNSLMNKKKDNPLPAHDSSMDLKSEYFWSFFHGQNCENSRFVYRRRGCV